MESEWRETTLGEFAPFNYGKGLPKHSRNDDGTVPVYGSNGITGYHDEPLLEKGIIIGRKGSIGEVEFCDGPFWPIDTTFYVEDSPERDLRFTYYLLKSLPLQEMNSDSAVPGLNRTNAHSLVIQVPCLDEQKRIAHILGTLDDKIELNQRMNATLEGIARAVFQSWFVDFDPVRAKMAGEPYPLPEAIMALFPDELVESELGMIPKGWEVKILENVADITDCLHSKKPSRKEHGKILLQVYNIGKRGRIDLTDKYFISDEDYTTWIKRFEATSYDIVISKTGRVGAVVQIPKGFKAALGRNLVGIRAKKKIINESYLRDLMLSQFMEDEIYRKSSSGTILRSIHVKHISELRLVKPDLELLKIYKHHINPFHDKINLNLFENELLAQKRDNLLSSIISD